MKRYSIVSSGIGHQAVESESGSYVTFDDHSKEIGALSRSVRELNLKARQKDATIDSLTAEVERTKAFCQWSDVNSATPPSMDKDVDIPIRIGWDGLGGLIPNVMLGYCVHVAEGFIWLDCKGNDLNLSPDQQPTHWGPAMLPPGV